MTGRKILGRKTKTSGLLDEGEKDFFLGGWKREIGKSELILGHNKIAVPMASLQVNTPWSTLEWAIFLDTHCTSKLLIAENGEVGRVTRH